MATMKRPVLVCNVGWMREYRGATRDDRPWGGGAYNVENAGSESLNFRKHQGAYHGFVRPGRGPRINVRRLGGDREAANGVLVVFCAPRPNAKETLVVGWYENATVYRNETPRRWGRGHFNIKAKDGILLAEPARSFRVPRVQRDGYGLGQSNVYYPDQVRDRAWLRRLKTYISTTKGEPGSVPRGQRGPSRQPDPETRTRVENAAIGHARQRYEALGFTVLTVEADNVGWDLECRLDDIRKLVEVKGLQGGTPAVELTPNEWAQMQRNAGEYELCIVCNALAKLPAIFVGRLARMPRGPAVMLEDGAVLRIKEAIAARIRP